MLKTVRTDSYNQDFIDLVKSLDADLAIRDGEDHSFYSQFNKMDLIKYAVVAYEHNIPLGCGAIKAFDANTMEIKRMYVIPESRGKGIASKILSDLEARALELAYKKCTLETGIRQPEAIGLYTKNGYRRIPNYGQYAGITGSLCFEKNLHKLNFHERVTFLKYYLENEGKKYILKKK
jgi:GNAT superfamily N-acetyltransferase